jgi:hypothetical protein
MNTETTMPAVDMEALNQDFLNSVDLGFEPIFNVGTSYNLFPIRQADKQTALIAMMLDEVRSYIGRLSSRDLTQGHKAIALILEDKTPSDMVSVNDLFVDISEISDRLNDKAIRYMIGTCLAEINA